MAPPKTILVTGASSGIGRAIANMLGTEGSLLHLVGRHATTLESVAQEVMAAGGSVRTHVSDLAAADERETLCAALCDTTFDWIVHSAGTIRLTGTDESTSTEDLRAIFEINTIAPLGITLALERQLSDCGGAIFVASTAGLTGNARFPAYAASKSALITLARSFATRWSDGERRAIALCPGPTNTPMRTAIADDASLQQSPEVIAEAVHDIIAQPNRFPNGETVSVRDGELRHVLFP